MVRHGVTDAIAVGEKCVKRATDAKVRIPDAIRGEGARASDAAGPRRCESHGRRLHTILMKA